MQTRGVLFHIVQLGDLAGAVAQQVGHLAWRERFYSAVLQLDAVHQAGGKGVSERVQALLFYASCCQDSVITLAEIYRPGVISMLVRYQGRVLSEVCLFPQVLYHGDGRVV